MTMIPTWVAAACVLLAAFLAASNMDYEEAKHSHDYYCEMVAIWHQNSALPISERPGWPPFDGECNGQD